MSAEVMPSSGETRSWQTRDNRHYLHPFTDHKLLGQQGSRIIERGEGIYIWDSDGNKLLDGMAGLWCVNLGYGRRELIDAAAKQMQELPYYNSFFQCAHPPAIELSEVLADVSPAEFNHVFFTGSGSEANDTQLRLIRRYWDLQGQTERTFVIARKNAYHGSTVAGASLGGMNPMHQQVGLQLPGIDHIDQPYHFELGVDVDETQFGIQQARLLEEKIQDIGPDRVAAFFAEPVQGAGGVIIPPASYWPEIQDICDRHGILLVADEVITGFGRMGEWFGSTYYDIRPDLISFAKGVTSGYLPLGGVLVSDRVAGPIIDEGGEFAHGFTYSGHPAACAVALENIRILREERVIEQVRSERAPYFGKAWASLGDHPLVGEARSVGLLGALELVRPNSGHDRFDKDLQAGIACRTASINAGLVMRAVGDTMIVSPPLVITTAQIDELVGKARQALDLTASALGV